MATLYEFYNTNEDANRGVYGAQWRAQTFTPASTHDIGSVKLKVSRLDSPGTVTVSIKATSAGKPTGGDLTSGTFDGDSLGQGFPGTWTEVSMSTISLTSGVQYAIVVRALTGDGSNRLNWNADTSSPTYAGGTELVSSDSGVGWSINTGTDAMFEVYGPDFVTKTFTADAKLSQDGVLKTFTADARLTKQNTKTFTADANTVRLKTFTADANLFKDSIPKTFTADTDILKVATKTFAADAHVYVVPDATWPQARAEAYDPDKLWDEDTKSWYLPTSSIGVERMAQAGGRLRSQLVVVSDQGKVFFGSF